MVIRRPTICARPNENAAKANRKIVREISHVCSLSNRGTAIQEQSAEHRRLRRRVSQTGKRRFLREVLGAKRFCGVSRRR